MVATMMVLAAVLGQAHMPSQGNPEGFQTTVVSWQKVYGEVQDVVRQGLGEYRKVFHTDDPAKFTREDRECLEAQVWLGQALLHAEGAPDHLKAAYDENVRRAKQLVDDKCRNGKGRNGQRLFIQWTVDLSERAGDYTRPAPQTVRLATPEVTVDFLLRMVDEFQATNGTFQVHPGDKLTEEQAARAAKVALVMAAWSRMFVAVGGYVSPTTGVPGRVR